MVPMQSDVDLATLAAGLTQRSRRALPLIGEDWTDEGWDKPLPNPNDAYSLWWGKDGKHNLVEIQLKPGTGVTGRAAQWQWRLTERGKALRQHLIDQGERA